MTRTNRAGTKILCQQCGAYLGDIFRTHTRVIFTLREAFDWDKKQQHYSLHKTGQGQYDRGETPTDSHGGRWTGGIPTGPDSWTWGPGPKARDIPGPPGFPTELFTQVPRERIPGGTRVPAGTQVKCPDKVMCGLVNTVTVPLDTRSAQS